MMVDERSVLVAPPDGAAAQAAMYGGVRLAGSEGRGADPLALGAVRESLFRAVPDRGVLQPGEVMEFVVTFTPQQCARCALCALAARVHTRACCMVTGAEGLPHRSRMCMRSSCCQTLRSCLVSCPP